MPLVAPAMREVPMESDEGALSLARGVAEGEFDALIFLTGVGVRALVTAVERANQRDHFLEALRRVRVIVRGPKPTAVLRELDVPIWAGAPEPNTWRELVATLDDRAGEWSLSGQRVAVQEYGASNPELLSALAARGAAVTPVQAYRWAMPEDLEPLREAARAIARGEVQVMLVTTGVQVTHLWQVVVAMGLEGDVRRGLARTLIGSIGPTASAELRRHGLEPAFEPSHPKMGLLVREAAERLKPSH